VVLLAYRFGAAQESLFADKACADLIMDWLVTEQKSTFIFQEVMAAMMALKQSERTVHKALKLLLAGKEPKIKRVKRGFYEVIKPCH